jgi:hypothetical protein
LEIAAVCRWFHRFMIEKQEINEAWIDSLRLQKVIHFIKTKNKNNPQWQRKNVIE